MFNYKTEIINRYNKEEKTRDESSSTPARTLKGERHIGGLKIITEEEEKEGEEEECYGDGGGEEYGDCDHDDDNYDDDNNNNNNNNNNCDLHVC